MNWKYILTIIAIVLFAGCTIIKQVMLEQPVEMIPVKVEVTDRYIKIHLIKTDRMYGYNIPWNNIVYFNSIGKIKIKQKRRDSQKWFVISVMDKDNKLKCDIYTLQESKAREFVDALYTLRTKVVIGKNSKNDKVAHTTGKLIDRVNNSK